MNEKELDPDRGDPRNLFGKSPVKNHPHTFARRLAIFGTTACLSTLSVPVHGQQPPDAAGEEAPDAAPEPGQGAAEPAEADPGEAPAETEPDETEPTETEPAETEPGEAPAEGQRVPAEREPRASEQEQSDASPPVLDAADEPESAFGDSQARSGAAGSGASSDEAGAGGTQASSEADDSAVAPPAQTATQDAHGFSLEPGGTPTGLGTTDSWFARPAFTASAGQDDNEISLTVYGFLQFDAIYDTTRSFADNIGDRLVARTDTFEGTTGRTQFSARNSRVGMLLRAPTVAGVSPTVIIEGDFFGNQPDEPPDVSETAFFDSPTFRLRHGFVYLKNDIVNVTIGQTFDLFGWQNYFYPATVEFLGLPSMVFSRPLQARLSKTLFEKKALSIDLGAAAVRPAQRDSQVPDGRAGVRFRVNDWKGLRSSGNGPAEVRPLAIGVSGVYRQFKVDAFTPPPTQSANEVAGWGLSADALVPVIPVNNPNDRGNALTLIGAFVMGTGIGDLMTATGGARFPTLPNEAQANPPPVYEGNIDTGLVSFDSQGVLNTIDWQGFRAGLQYYLPPNGRVTVAINYTQAHSDNMAALFPQGGAEIELLGRVADRQQYADASIMWDATNALRFGIGGSYMTVRYLDGDQPSNIRARFQTAYYF